MACLCIFFCFFLIVSPDNLHTVTRSKTHAKQSSSDKHSVWLKKIDAAQRLIASHHAQNIQQGSDLLESLIKDPLFKQQQVQIRVGLIYKLIKAYQKIGAIDREEKFIEKWIQDKQYRNYHIHLKLKLAYDLLEHKRLESCIAHVQESRDLSAHANEEEKEQIQILSKLIDQYYENKLTSAEQSFLAEKIEYSLQIYEEVLLAIQKRHFPLTNESQQNRIDLLCRLELRYCQGLVALEKWQTAHERLSQRKMQNYRTDPDRYQLWIDGCLLDALCLYHLKSYQDSLTSFQVLFDPSCHLTEKDWAVFCTYAGLTTYHLQHTQLLYAICSLAISHIKGEQAVAFHLWLVQWHLGRREIEESLNILATLENTNQLLPLQKDHILYLKARAYLMKGALSKSSFYLNQKLTQNGHDSSFQGQFLASLGTLCLKHFIQDRLTKNLTSLLDEADLYFTQALHHTFNDEAVLGLSYCALLRNSLTQSPDNVQAAVIHLRQHILQLSLDSQQEAYLLLADCTEDPYEKKRLLDKATENSFYDGILWGESWLKKGVHLTRCAQTIESQADLLKGEALEAFDTAHQWFLRKKQKDKAYIVQLEMARLLALSSDPSDLKQALELLTHLEETRKNHFNPHIYLEDLLHISITCHFELFNLTLDPFHAIQAEQSMEKMFNQFPHSPLTQKTLIVLAKGWSLHHNFSKTEYWCEKSINLSCLEYQDEALYLLALCYDKSQNQPAAQRIRRQIFEQFPSSSYADESYFRYYPYSDYKDGYKEALTHLERMPILFKTSPYLMLCYYLLGKAETQQALAWIKRDSHQHGIHAFEYFEKIQRYYLNHLWKDASNSCSIPFWTRFLYIQSILHKAILLHAGCIPKPLVLTDSVIPSYELALSEIHSVSLQSINSYETALLLQLHREALHGIALHHIKLNAYHEALTVLVRLSTICQGNTIEDSVWQIQTALAQSKSLRAIGKIENALSILHNVETLASDLKQQRELYLQVLIGQSRCQRQAGNLEKAMMLLSRVINDEVSSTLRIKAMFLRAEIYEEQQRIELAIRQLEAAAKKGGEWGSKAINKLETTYGNRLR